MLGGVVVRNYHTKFCFILLIRLYAIRKETSISVSNDKHFEQNFDHLNQCSYLNDFSLYTMQDEQMICLIISTDSIFGVLKKKYFFMKILLHRHEYLVRYITTKKNIIPKYASVVDPKDLPNTSLLSYYLLWIKLL